MGWCCPYRNFFHHHAVLSNHGVYLVLESIKKALERKSFCPVKASLQQYGGYLSKDFFNSIHELVFTILNLLEKDSSISPPPQPLIHPHLLVSSHPFPSLNLKLHSIDTPTTFTED